MFSLISLASGRARTWYMGGPGVALEQKQSMQVLEEFGGMLSQENFWNAMRLLLAASEIPLVNYY